MCNESYNENKKTDYHLRHRIFFGSCSELKLAILVWNIVMIIRFYMHFFLSSDMVLRSNQMTMNTNIVWILNRLCVCCLCCLHFFFSCRFFQWHIVGNDYGHFPNKNKKGEEMHHKKDKKSFWNGSVKRLKTKIKKIFSFLCPICLSLHEDNNQNIWRTEKVKRTEEKEIGFDKIIFHFLRSQNWIEIMSTNIFFPSSNTNIWNIFPFFFLSTFYICFRLYLVGRHQFYETLLCSADQPTSNKIVLEKRKREKNKLFVHNDCHWKWKWCKDDTKRHFKWLRWRKRARKCICI